MEVKAKFLQLIHLKTEFLCLSRTAVAVFVSICCFGFLFGLLWVGLFWFFSFLVQKFFYMFNKLTEAQLRILFSAFINQLIFFEI